MKQSLLFNESDKGTSNQSTYAPSNLTHRINETKNDSFSGNKEALSYESMSRCARFDFCSAPKCPLDLLIDLRIEVETDPRCDMAKPTRHKYWESMPDAIKSRLKFEGYLESEYNRMKTAKERWLALPEQEKAEIRERMKNARQNKEAQS